MENQNNGLVGKFNYRHSLDSLNKALSNVGHKIDFFMQSGKPVYTLSEKNNEGKFVTCGFYYKAADIAEITNKLINKS